MSTPFVLVLGMHRSGTSALAGALTRLGGHAPAHLMQPTAHNERGFWESTVVTALNDEILAANGSAWDDWRRVDPGWYDGPAVGDFRARAAASLADEFGAAALPVVKDPRICRLMPFWSSVFAELGWSSRVLLPVRSPLEVARSLQQRDGMSLNRASLLWLRHVLEAEAESRGTPRAIVDWNDMFSDWRRALARAAEQMGIDLPGHSDSDFLEVDEFLSSDLRHQHATDEELRLHPAINEWVRAAYAALLRLVEDPACKAARRTLDDIRARFDAAALVFSGVLQEEEQAWRDKLALNEQDRERRLAESERSWREKLALSEQDWERRSGENDQVWRERLAIRETELEEVEKKATEYADQLDKMMGLFFWKVHEFFYSMSQIGPRLLRFASRHENQECRQSRATHSANGDFADTIIALPLGYQPPPLQPIPRVAVLFHAYYVEDLSDFQRALRNISFSFALFVSTDTKQKTTAIEERVVDWKHGPVEVRVFPNRGRDIAPKFVGFRDVHRDYEFVLHIHTKRSPHNDFGGWRPLLLDCLLGSPQIVAGVFELFSECPTLGIVAPRNFPLIRHCMTWDVNFDKCARLAKRMGITLHEDSPIDFAAGSMFWARSAALKPLLDLNLTFDDFDKERGQTDGALAHAVERLTFYSCEAAGYGWCHAGPAKDLAYFERALHISSRDDLGKVPRAGLLSSNTIQGSSQSHHNPESSLRARKKESERALQVSEKALNTIRRSSFFDGEFYLQANPDVNAAGVDPALHYLLHGGSEGRDPGRYFSTKGYLQQNPDVAEKGMNALLHYELHGRSEGRKLHGIDAATSLLSVARSMIESAKSAKERSEFRSDLPAPLRLTGLRKELRLESYRGLLVSASHDDFAETFGGVQNCIADEEAAFAKQGWAHLHVSPAYPLPALSESTSVADFLVSARLNGMWLGIATAADLVEQLTPARRSQKRCFFVLHHLAGFSTEVVAEFVKTIQPDRNLAWIHDFFTICPSYTLLRNDVAFCGAPPEQSQACGICCYGCERHAHLTRVRNLFDVLNPEILAPSEGTLSFWLTHSNLPHARSKVIPHGKLSPSTQTAKRPGCGPLRVGFIGAPTYFKGWSVFEKLAADFRGDSRYRFFRLGTSPYRTKNDDIHFHAVKVDRLSRDAMTRAVTALRLDVAVLWSLWPETFCFAAHESLAGGAFIVTREGAGNIASIVAGTYPARGCVLKEEGELFELFQSGKIRELVTSHEMGCFEPVSGTATFLLHETVDG